MLESVSIGGTLAGARHQAGLTVSDVSARTRIRQALIRAIEKDEFGVCGGDFYARGHIRAIARTVGVDSEPLISEYDAAHPSGQPVTMDDLPRERRRVRGPWGFLAVLLVGLVVIGFGSYRLVSRSGGTQRLASAASSGRASARPASHSQRPTPAVSSSSPPASARPAPTVTPRASSVTPVSAAAFGPGGTSDGDNPQNASLALSGDSATPWNTDWYASAQFGNLKTGTGLLADLGRTVTATSVTIRLGSASGADFQVRAGTSPGDLSTVAHASGAGGTVRLPLATPAAVRYVLIWFTLLPPDADGTYQADISGVTVAASGNG